LEDFLDAYKQILFLFVFKCVIL